MQRKSIVFPFVCNVEKLNIDCQLGRIKHHLEDSFWTCLIGNSSLQQVGKTHLHSTQQNSKGLNRRLNHRQGRKRTGHHHLSLLDSWMLISCGWPAVLNFYHHEFPAMINFISELWGIGNLFWFNLFFR